jgi:hypothetical protein
MTDEEYLKARGWVLMREEERGMVAACRNRLNFVPVAEAVETQIAEDRAVADYVAARGVPSGHLIAVSSSGGVASGGSGSAVVSRVSGPVGFTGGGATTVRRSGTVRVTTEDGVSASFAVDAGDTLASIAERVSIALAAAEKR